MGRAISYQRVLRMKLNEVKKFWLGAENKIADSHLPWAKEVQSRINITEDNVDEVMEQELANVFLPMFWKMRESLRMMQLKMKVGNDSLML